MNPGQLCDQLELVVDHNAGFCSRFCEECRPRIPHRENRLCEDWIRRDGVVVPQEEVFNTIRTTCVKQGASLKIRMSLPIRHNDAQPMKSQTVTRPGYQGADSGDSTQAPVTRDPLQGTPESMAESKTEKLGPGVRYTPESRVGPTIKPPPINRSAQSDLAKELEGGLADDGDYDGEGDNPKTIDREDLFQNQSELYGNT